jgi:hypothetical protein
MQIEGLPFSNLGSDLEMWPGIRLFFIAFLRSDLVLSHFPSCVQ